MSQAQATERKQKLRVLNPKYWIETGEEVMHRDFPQTKMYVDKIVKQTKLIKNGDSSRMATFILGVDCHWIGEDKNFKTGRFLTMELLPWQEEKRTLVTEFQKKESQKKSFTKDDQSPV